MVSWIPYHHMDNVIVFGKIPPGSHRAASLAGRRYRSGTESRGHAGTKDPQERGHQQN